MRPVERLAQLIGSFTEATVAGLGDLMLDQYRRGSAHSLSPEAPVPDLVNPDLSETPGGAANVASNIAHAGGQVRLVGLVGTDAEGKRLRELLGGIPGVTLNLVEDPARATTVKLRFYHQQFQVLRVSYESPQPLAAAIEARCREMLEKAIPSAQALFVEDYGKRLITPGMVEGLIALVASRPGLPVILDPKIGNHDSYRAGMCTVLKPNWREACVLAGSDARTTSRDEIVRRVGERYACDVLLTLGGEGVLLYERAKSRVLHIPARPREAFDIAGAGDTTLAIATLALAAGASLTEAAFLANLAGGLVVEKSGTAFVTSEELERELAHPVTQSILATLEAQTVRT